MNTREERINKYLNDIKWYKPETDKEIEYIEYLTDVGYVKFVDTYSKSVFNNLIMENAVIDKTFIDCFYPEIDWNCFIKYMPDEDYNLYDYTLKTYMSYVLKFIDTSFNNNLYNMDYMINLSQYSKFYNEYLITKIISYDHINREYKWDIINNGIYYYRDNNKFFICAMDNIIKYIPTVDIEELFECLKQKNTTYGIHFDVKTKIDVVKLLLHIGVDSNIILSMNNLDTKIYFLFDNITKENISQYDLYRLLINEFETKDISAFEKLINKEEFTNYLLNELEYITITSKEVRFINKFYKYIDKHKLTEYIKNSSYYTLKSLNEFISDGIYKNGIKYNKKIYSRAFQIAKEYNKDENLLEKRINLGFSIDECFSMSDENYLEYDSLILPYRDNYTINQICEKIDYNYLYFKSRIEDGYTFKEIFDSYAPNMLIDKKYKPKNTADLLISYDKYITNDIKSLLTRTFKNTKGDYNTVQKLIKSYFKISKLFTSLPTVICEKTYDNDTEYFNIINFHMSVHTYQKRKEIIDNINKHKKEVMQFVYQYMTLTDNRIALIKDYLYISNCIITNDRVFEIKFGIKNDKIKK